MKTTSHICAYLVSLCFFKHHENLQNHTIPFTHIPFYENVKIYSSTRKATRNFCSRNKLRHVYFGYVYLVGSFASLYTKNFEISLVTIMYLVQNYWKDTDYTLHTEVIIVTLALV
jgi:hypothetical protein